MHSSYVRTMLLALIVGSWLVAPAEAGAIFASGSVFVSGGTCSLNTGVGFYDESCSDSLGTDARALATVTPGSEFPSLAALAMISSPLSSVGATAAADAWVEDELDVDLGTATVQFSFEIDGIISESGTPGDGPSAFFQFDAPGGFTFQEFSASVPSTILMTRPIPVPTTGRLGYLLELKAGAGAPGGGNQTVDFSSTLKIIDVIQRDASGNRVFTPIVSALGFSYGQATGSVPEPSSVLLMLLGMGALARRRCRR